MTHTKLFSDNSGVTAMDLVNEFKSVDKIVYTPVEEFAAFINEQGKGHFTDPEDIAREVQKAARSSYRLPEVIQDSVN